MSRDARLLAFPESVLVTRRKRSAVAVSAVLDQERARSWLARVWFFLAFGAATLTLVSVTAALALAALHLP